MLSWKISMLYSKNPEEIEPHPVLIHPMRTDTKNINEKETKKYIYLFYGIQDL